MGDYHWKSKNVKSCGIDDMVLLSKIEISSISENLKKRLMEDLIYTYIGAVVIAVNPFKPLSNFTEREIELYQNSVSYENPPHIYSLCDSVFKNLLNENESQCVIISGESGAGKTVSAKYVMNYITKVSGGSGNVQRIKDIILQSNPLLEAFGNAKTLRNDNSSRFGKYVEILFKKGGVPEGGRISNFLLEKSRVCSQNKGERNFHIFYQILSGLDSGKKNKLSLTSPGDYEYLKNSDCYTVEGIDDAKDYIDVVSSMNTCGLGKDIQDALFDILAGILHLGNIKFKEEKNQAQPINPASLNLPSKLLMIDSQGLLTALISREMESKWGTKSEKIKIEHNIEQATFTRDAIAKAIYFRIFSYLVDTINIAIDKKDLEKAVGILDIYGFEIFKKNGFEQFCINFVNEKLQQIFIELTLKVEQEEYVQENINWTPIKYFNNKVVCDLIELTKNPSGIISIMDDVCATMHAKGEGADRKLVEDLSKAISGNPHFFISGAGFIVSHYAGKVTYDIDGFCEKNRDVLFTDPIDVLKKSKCAFLANLFPENTSSEIKSRPTTAGSKIRIQANQLIEKLMKCQPHYIRCIKPNETKKPYDFDEERVKHQIEYQGLKENIRIKRAGFAYRRPFGKFLDRFAILTPETYPRWKGAEKDGIAHIMNSVNVEASEWQCGKTKVFIKKPESLYMLEELLDRKYDGYARTIQKQWRLTNNQTIYDKEKVKAAEIMRNNKQRYRASINRKFYGNYYNLEDQPFLLSFIEKKEVVQFSTVINKYDRKFRSCKRDMLVTQKNIYFIGRELISKGPQKGKIVEVLKRKIALPEIAEIQMSSLQDDFIALQVQQDYSSLFETPLKTEFVFTVNKFHSKITNTNVKVTFKNQLDVHLKKAGFRAKSHMLVQLLENPRLINDLRILKPSLTKLNVEIRTGQPSSSMPVVRTAAPKSNNAIPVTKDRWAAPPSQKLVQRQTTDSLDNIAPPEVIPKHAKPLPKPPSSIVRCKALWAYQGSQDGELSFEAGAVFEVVKEDENGWWTGRYNGMTGLFPYNYIQKI